MLSICCVGFAFLDIVCNELNDCAWNVGLLCFVPMLHGCVWYVSSYVRKKFLFLQLLRGGILACMRCPCLCLCWILGWGLC